MTSIQLADEHEYICVDMRQIASELEARSDQRSRAESSVLFDIVDRFTALFEEGGSEEQFAAVERDIDSLTNELRNRGDHASLMEAFALSTVASDLSYFLHKVFEEEEEAIG